ncbi:hypothetical protein BDW59DRAFT_23850 [Aspergillus cavernicola]|uniref:Uncharacterized protein n=1 Tax=Aspergillus cavernicola TaxID=176166 RepID=A0ABR4IRI0_9EURO
MICGVVKLDAESEFQESEGEINCSSGGEGGTWNGKEVRKRGQDKERCSSGKIKRRDGPVSRGVKGQI